MTTTTKQIRPFEMFTPDDVRKTWVVDAIMMRPELTSTEKLVYARLARCEGAKPDEKKKKGAWECRPKLVTLAYYCGISWETAQRAVKALEGHGLIEVEHRRHQHRPSLITFLDHPWLHVKWPKDPPSDTSKCRGRATRQDDVSTPRSHVKLPCRDTSSCRGPTRQDDVAHEESPTEDCLFEESQRVKTLSHPAVPAGAPAASERETVARSEAAERPNDKAGTTDATTRDRNATPAPTSPDATDATDPHPQVPLAPLSANAAQTAKVAPGTTNDVEDEPLDELKARIHAQLKDNPSEQVKHLLLIWRFHHEDDYGKSLPAWTKQDEKLMAEMLQRAMDDWDKPGDWEKMEKYIDYLFNDWSKLQAKWSKSAGRVPSLSFARARMADEYPSAIVALDDKFDEYKAKVFPEAVAA